MAVKYILHVTTYSLSPQCEVDHLHSNECACSTGRSPASPSLGAYSLYSPRKASLDPAPLRAVSARPKWTYEIAPASTRPASPRRHIGIGMKPAQSRRRLRPEASSTTSSTAKHQLHQLLRQYCLRFTGRWRRAASSTDTIYDKIPRGKWAAPTHHMQGGIHPDLKIAG